MGGICTHQNNEFSQRSNLLAKDQMSQLKHLPHIENMKNVFPTIICGRYTINDVCIYTECRDCLLSSKITPYKLKQLVESKQFELLGKVDNSIYMSTIINNNIYYFTIETNIIGSILTNKINSIYYDGIWHNINNNNNKITNKINNKLSNPDFYT
jgi:hypothetical protein